MDSKKFSTILIVVFIIAAVLAVLLFSGAIKIGNSKSNNTPSGQVIIWGTIPQSNLSDILDKASISTKTISISYVERERDTFAKELTKATLNGFAPDLIIAPEDVIFSVSGFVKKTDYNAFPESTFRQSYLEIGEIFLNKDGILSLPITVDPLVLFYNRDILSLSGLSQPPAIWDEIFIMNDLITQKDKSGVITRATLPFGIFDNVFHAKDILATLFLQSGNNIVSDNLGQKISTLLNDELNLKKIITFFMSFSDPISTVYSWNRALPESRDMFVVGKLAFYPGFASEIYTLREKNPNLNFAPTQIPQIRDTERPTTLGHVLGISMLKSSGNQPASYSVALLLSGKEFSGAISDTLGLPSARRDVMGSSSSTSYGNLFLRSALIARSWYDANTYETNRIFKEMIDGINRGKNSVDQAISNANGEMNNLLQQ